MTIARYDLEQGDHRWGNGVPMMAENELGDYVTYEDHVAALNASEERERALRDELEKARVQLAGCGAAALGWTKDPAKKGDWGWSPAYQDTLNLRLKYEASQQRVGTLTEAINKVWEVASGECQVAMDDTQGMEWISDYLSSIEDISEAVAALATPAPEPAQEGKPTREWLEGWALCRHDKLLKRCPECATEQPAQPSAENGRQ